MPFNPQKHARRSIRLKGWDYSQPSWYYVTIVVKERICHFGRVVIDAVDLSELGRAADACWRQIPEHHEHVGLDEHVVMPNHVHGIVIINEQPRGDVHDGDVYRRDVPRLPRWID